MNVKLRRLLMPLLRHDAAGKPPTFRTRSAARQAIYLIEKPVSLKSKAAKVQQRIEKQTARASHNQETAAIREEVMKRPGGRCELCGYAPATELHHLEGGSGRTALQAVSNCMAACSACHRAFHRSPEFFRAVVLLWAAAYGYPIPRRYRGPPKVVAAGPPEAAKDVSDFVDVIHAEPAKAGGAP